MRKVNYSGVSLDTLKREAAEIGVSASRIASTSEIKEVKELAEGIKKLTAVLVEVFRRGQFRLD